MGVKSTTDGIGHCSLSSKAVIYLDNVSWPTGECGALIFENAAYGVSVPIGDYNSLFKCLEFQIGKASGAIKFHRKAFEERKIWMFK